MLREAGVRAAFLILNDPIAENTKLVEETIARLDSEIGNRGLNTPEDRRLVTIVKRLRNQLKEYLPKIAAGASLPGCCLYEGENYLETALAIADKQSRVERAIQQLKITPMGPGVHEYFEKTLAKLKRGVNVPLPDFFHATRAGFESIVDSQTILQSKSGAAGPGTYVSCNNEGDFGYGAHAFAIDESCLMNTRGTFFTGRQPGTNVFYSLWAAVLKDISVNEQSIAFIDTSLDDIPYVRELLQAHNLDIEVVDRETSKGIHKILDLSTKRRELPSFFWNKRQLNDYLPDNMYPRSEQGSFRNMIPLD